MGRILVTALMLAQLFTAPVSAQRRAAASQTTTRQVQYDQLDDYVNDRERHRLGERFVVTDVPLIKEIKRADQPGLSYVTINEVSGVSANFVTSSALARALRPHLKGEASYYRVTCTLVEFSGGLDDYRSPFATKIEGFNYDGKLLWTLTGAQPARVRFRL